MQQKNLCVKFTSNSRYFNIENKTTLHSETLVFNLQYNLYVYIKYSSYDWERIVFATSKSIAIDACGCVNWVEAGW